ncbi:hypothetical protein HYH03_006943 [Edaphochlamys debaryana]|uniref:Uncharacterized protein n=1 Tax=Edaphochlamys debaryana TaxID=47281 RepID=A0A836BZT4_9CHLO|nr:hypothetical protein HYH03_006943 [Edaphochlamys debaryana]|eukprot:KAG2495010.1 hypothetical protein HYH03_006943 [Edaphochlamys debaryana]
MMAAHSRRPAGLGACIMLDLLMALPSVIQVANSAAAQASSAAAKPKAVGRRAYAARVQKRYNIEDNTLGEDCAALGTPPTVIEGSTCRDWFFFDFDWYTDKANLMSSKPTL